MLGGYGTKDMKSKTKKKENAKEVFKENGFWRFEGACEGVLQDQLSGAHGFGYDPLFQPQGYHQTFGELGSEIKDQISHRSRALHQLKDFLIL